MATKSVKLKLCIIFLLAFIVSVFASVALSSHTNTAFASDGNTFKIAGAGVKIVNDKDDSGLRFSFLIKEDYFDEVLSSGSSFNSGVETGALVVPTRLLPDGFDSNDALKSVNGSKIVKKTISYKYWETSTVYDGYKESYVYLYGLPEDCYNWDVTCIGYITVNGVTKYTSICERSMSYVANAEINDPNSRLTSSQKTMLGLYLTNQKLTVNDVEYTNMTYGKTLNEFVVTNGLMPEDCDYVVFNDASGNYVPNSTVIKNSMVLSATYYKGVSTLAELRAINGSTDNYILLNDIDAENATFANTDFIPSFGGILEGNGYAIKNVKVKAGSRYWVAALFGTISGTVQNLKLENITICKSGDNTYTGKSAFMAGSITGTVKNIWITGTMEASTADTSVNADTGLKDKRPAFIANNAEGGSISNFLIEVANTVAGTYIVTSRTATHWGGVYVIGSASGWAGAGTRDLGGIAGPPTTDAAAIYSSASADLTDDVWTRDATTGVITMVKGGAAPLEYYTIESYVETGVNNTGKYVLESVEKVTVKDCALSVDYAAPSKAKYTLNNDVSVTSAEFKFDKTLKLYYDLDEVTLTVKNAAGTATLFSGDIPFGSIFDQSAVLASDEVGMYQTEGGYAFDINSPITEDTVLYLAGTYKKITTLTELRAINGSTDNYILLNDIDAENATFANTDFIPSFGGVLEGNGYAIKNVKVKAGSRYWVAALFGTISGTVQNLKLENITICKSGDNTYTGKTAFMAGSITGTVKNIWITGTMEESTADTSSKISRPSIVANDATGGNISDILIEVDSIVTFTYIITGGTATHWGGVYVIGPASGWSGWAGSSSSPTISGKSYGGPGTNAAVIYNSASADLTDDVWTCDATTGVITMVKGYKYGAGSILNYTVKYCFENENGVFIPDDSKEYTSTHEFGEEISIETEDVAGYEPVMDYSSVLLLADNQVVTVLYKKTEISNDDDIEYMVEYYYEQNDGTFVKDDTKTENKVGKGNSVIKVTASAASAVANYHTDTYSDFDVVDLVLDEFGKVAKIYYYLDKYEVTVLDANDDSKVVYQGEVLKNTPFDTTKIVFTDGSEIFSLKYANGDEYVSQNVTDDLTLYIVYGKPVSTAEDFFGVDGTSYYVLTNDVDFSGESFTQVPTLGGVFDGNGYSLKNITLEKKDSYGKGGVFGEVTGIVKNLSIDGLTFVGTGKSGSEYVGESGILAYTVSGKVENVSINATITGKLRGHNGFTDFSGWDWHFGYVCFNANGATINNVTVNVSNAVNSADISRFYLCSATGNYTLGSLYVVNQDGEDNPSAVSGGSATALSGRWVGIDSPDVIVSVMAARVDYTVWNYDKQDAVPYLRKNVYNPTYFYDGQSCGYTVCYSGVASEGELAGKNLIVDLTSDILGETLTQKNTTEHFNSNNKILSIGITVTSNEYAVTQGYANTTALLNAYNVGRSGFIIRTVGKTVLIMGLTSEACYYGCQEFANMVFGYEQFTDGAYIVDDSINSSSKIILGQYDIVDIPDIANRAVYFYNVNDQRDGNGDVTVDNSAYRYAMRLEDANDKNTYIVGGHSQEMFVDQNISAHPGWFPNDVFCWSNTTAVNAYVDYLFSVYAGSESVRNYNNYLIHLGQCDVDKYCKCNNCKNARSAYGGETNAAVSAQQLAFANSVADKFMAKLATDGSAYVKPNYSPSIVFTIFAYMYSQTPPATYSSGTWTPLVTANANVSFFFAPIRDDYSISVDEQSTKNDFEGWKAVCSNSNIFVWTYGTNFKQYFVNINNFDAIKGTYKFYAENGVTYIMDQGPSTSGTPTFEELRVYLDSKLMWNTDRSTGLLVDKFINGYYGPGAWGVKQYYNAIKDTTVSGTIYVDIGTSSIWTNAKLNSLATLLDNAIAAVDGSALSSDEKTEYKNRIYRLYCTIWYLQADLNYAEVSSYTKAQAIANLKYYAEMYNMTEYAETHSLEDKSWY